MDRSPAECGSIIGPGNLRGRLHMITNSASGTNIQRNRGGHLSHQYAGVDSRHAGLQLQPVPGRRRRAVPVPHGPAWAVSCRQRGDRRGHAGRTIAVCRAVALRSRRVRRYQRVPRGRAECSSCLQPCGSDDVGERLRRSAAARARRQGGAGSRSPSRALVRHAARAARVGVRPRDGHDDAHVLLRRLCLRRVAAARSRSRSRTSSVRAKRSGSRSTTLRTHRRRARCSKR